MMKKESIFSLVSRVVLGSPYLCIMEEHEGVLCPLVECWLVVVEQADRDVVVGQGAVMLTLHLQLQVR